MPLVHLCLHNGRVSYISGSGRASSSWMLEYLAASPVVNMQRNSLTLSGRAGVCISFRAPTTHRYGRTTDGRQHWRHDRRIPIPRRVRLLGGWIAEFNSCPSFRIEPTPLLIMTLLLVAVLDPTGGCSGRSILHHRELVVGLVMVVLLLLVLLFRRTYISGWSVGCIIINLLRNWWVMPAPSTQSYRATHLGRSAGRMTERLERNESHRVGFESGRVELSFHELLLLMLLLPAKDQTASFIKIGVEINLREDYTKHVNNEKSRGTIWTLAIQSMTTAILEINWVPITCRNVSECELISILENSSLEPH